MRGQEVSHLGFPGAETPKHHNFSTLYRFGVSQVGVSGLASIRDSPLGIPGAETPKTLYPPSSFQGFACRDFRLCEDITTHPC
jgi:hypothetical protein